MDCEVRSDPVPFARLQRVGKRFEDVTVLAELHLTIHQGAFVSLLGPSGCGKSTVLRLLAGLTAPSSGTVELGTAGTPARISYVFQDAALMPWRTVLANVELPLQLSGVGKAEREAAARAALERVGLGGWAAAYPLELSGGMAMRVSLARALATRPQVLLLDEPFAALDEISRLALNDELLRLWRTEAFTAVFVTHSVSEAVYLSQRVCLMAPHPGRIVEEYAIELAGESRVPALRESPDYRGYVRAITERLSGIVAS